MTSGLTSSYRAADTSRPVWEMTAGDALRRAAELARDRAALVEAAPKGLASVSGAATTDRRWTYVELLVDAEACARWLLARFAPGDHICLWAPNVPEWVIVQYGAALAGLVLVTANPSLRAEELRHVLDRSKAKALIHVEAFRGSDMTAIARIAAPSLDHILIGEVAAAIPRHRHGSPLPAVSPLAPAQMQFTSGTTGRPKGALLTHRALVTNASLVATRIGQGGDTVVTPMPLFHTAGSVLGVLGAVTSLSTLVLPVLFDPVLMLDTIQRERGTVTSGVPTMLAAMMAELDRADYDLSSLRILFSGGAPVAPELLARVEQRFGCRMMSVYGQTELSPIICATDYNDTQADRAGTAGRPLPQVEVRIVQPGTHDPLPLGDQGEIQARGYQTMIGYYGQPDETDLTLLADGWLRTGDLGLMDDRGYVQVTGRLSDMIIRGGENIYPAEIEAVLLRHPAIAEVAVFGIPHPTWGETVAASVRLREGLATVDHQQLKDHCRSLLSPQKTPSSWFVASEFPLTASGKIQKFALSQQAAEGSLHSL
ncbi:AMP-binding protein [Sphingomonas sp. TX0543]|uniref:AMP-binding protein n=2 Tax=Alphaproteobacteria TaxID=28211 RepID=UPI0011434F3A|nr:AMP-binding protein [Porphyrobacter sp. YT40]QDH34981.1 AMP-binding protein [Porphyrobacter sp. YT40]